MSLLVTLIRASLNKFFDCKILTRTSSIAEQRYTAPEVVLFSRRGESGALASKPLFIKTHLETPLSCIQIN